MHILTPGQFSQIVWTVFENQIVLHRIGRCIVSTDVQQANNIFTLLKHLQIFDFPRNYFVPTNLQKTQNFYQKIIVTEEITSTYALHYICFEGHSFDGNRLVCSAFKTFENFTVRAIADAQLCNVFL